MENSNLKNNKYLPLIQIKAKLEEMGVAEKIVRRRFLNGFWFG